MLSCFGNDDYFHRQICTLFSLGFLNVSGYKVVSPRKYLASLIYCMAESSARAIHTLCLSSPLFFTIFAGYSLTFKTFWRSPASRPTVRLPFSATLWSYLLSPEILRAIRESDHLLFLIAGKKIKPSPAPV